MTGRRIFFSKRPLDASVLLDHPVVADAGDVAGLAASKFLQLLKDCFRARPVAEHLTTSPVVSDRAEDGEISKSLPWRPCDFFHQPESPFGVNEDASLPANQRDQGTQEEEVDPGESVCALVERENSSTITSMSVHR